METGHKPIRVTFQIHRNLSDFRKPRYTAEFGKLVVADGQTLNEARDRACDVALKVWPSAEADFVLVVE